MQQLKNLALALLLGVAPTLQAAETAPAQPAPSWSETASKGQVRVDGHKLDYRSLFTQLWLGPQGAPQASISATSYLRLPQDQQRPVMFVFNGGPGASSSPLHFSGLGPWLQQDGKDGKRTLVPNPDTALDMTDLVFIDTPGTGFSKAPESDEARKLYWSPAGDASAVLQLIRLWLDKHDRTGSPVYIAGESYGGYRLALLLGQAKDLNLAGVLMISPMLDASAESDSQGNDLPFIFALPTMAVAAVNAGKVNADGADVATVYARARTFALGDYALALMQGDALPQAQRQQMAARVAALIGLSPQQVLDHDLRLDVETYRKALLADAGKVMGRLDTRVIVDVPKRTANRPSAANDPALGLGASNVIRSPLIGDYLRKQLGVQESGDYVALSLDVNFAWNWNQATDPSAGDDRSLFYFNPTPNIAAQIKQHPDLRVMVVSGYYDLAVPALAPWYALNHAGVNQQNVHYELLDAGHSVFGDSASRHTLKALLRKDLFE